MNKISGMESILRNICIHVEVALKWILNSVTFLTLMQLDFQYNELDLLSELLIVEFMDVTTGLWPRISFIFLKNLKLDFSLAPLVAIYF